MALALAAMRALVEGEARSDETEKKKNNIGIAFFFSSSLCVLLFQSKASRSLRRRPCPSHPFARTLIWVCRRRQARKVGQRNKKKRTYLSTLCTNEGRLFMPLAR